MDLEAAHAYLRDNHRAVMHTYRQDGSPQLSPVVVTVDDEGRGLVSTREGSVKVQNLERDPRTSLCVIPDDFFGQWIRVDATADIVHLPEAMDLLIDYYRRLSGEHENWDDYRRAMNEERRVMLRLTLRAAGPDVAG